VPSDADGSRRTVPRLRCSTAIT